MNARTVFFAFAVIGCVALHSTTAQAQDVKTEINRMKLNIEETERLNQEQISRVNANLNQMNENMTAIVTQMNAITAKVQEVEARNRQLESELALVKKQVQSESAARQEGMKKFATEISKELTAMPKAAPQPVQVAAPAAAAAPAASSSAETGGEFLEYTVQKGATLTAIATAYKVSVGEIRKANNMGNDAVLRVGQKLLIPKK